MYGHFHASALRAVALLGIADHLAEGARTAEDLAERSGARPDLLRRVLRLLATHGLFHEDGSGTFSLTQSGRPLRTDVPGSQHAAVLMFTDEMFRSSAEHLTHTLRTGEPGFEAAYGVPFFDHLAATPPAGRLFNAAMASRGDVDHHIVSGYPFPDSGTVVDVGGGRGGLLRELLVQSPGLTGILYDRAETVADHLLNAPSLAGRWSVQDGDFFVSVPKDGDLYLLKNILHDWSDEDCLRILAALREAMTDGTRLLVIDAVLPDDGTPHPASGLDIVMLSLLRGRERTAAEFEVLLARAGFRLNRVVPTSALPSVVEAEAI
ncbi:SAM-dependent methyltransferase [Streptomyces sp. MMG1121]|nr:SAM-dependent methyltransferase [Streptomyces sp. MMG1121]